MTRALAVALAMLIAVIASVQCGMDIISGSGMPIGSRWGQPDSYSRRFALASRHPSSVNRQADSDSRASRRQWNRLKMMFHGADEADFAALDGLVRSASQQSSSRSSADANSAALEDLLRSISSSNQNRRGWGDLAPSWG